MAKTAYIGLGSKASSLITGYIGVDDVAAKLDKAYIGIGGKAFQCWSNPSSEVTAKCPIEQRGNVLNLTAVAGHAATQVGKVSYFGGGFTPGTTNTTTALVGIDENLTATVTDLTKDRSDLAAATTTTKANVTNGDPVEIAIGLFGGGISKNTTLTNAVNAVDETGTVGTLTGLATAKSNLAAAGNETFVIFAGGANGSTQFNNVEVYASPTLQRGSAQALSVKRLMIAAGAIDRFLVFAGGSYSGSSAAFSPVVDAYDDELVRRTPQSLGVARNAAAIARTGPHLLVGGGNSSGTAVAIVDVYNEELTKQQSVELSQARIGAAAVQNESAKCAIFAGGRAAANETSDVVDVFDPQLVRTIATPLKQARYSIACAGADDRVIFYGGRATAAGAAVSTHEVYRAI